MTTTKEVKVRRFSRLNREGFEVPEIPVLEAEEKISEAILPDMYASKSLGYVSPREQKIRDTRSQKMTEYREKCAKRDQAEHFASIPLVKAMTDAGIKPFTTQSIRKYQEEKMILRCDWSAVFSFMSIIGILCTAFAKFAAGAENTGWTFLGSVTALICSFLIPAPPQKAWRVVDLKGYDGNVPTFALATAQEIHMRCPAAQFKVAELVDRKSQINHDPFLLVTDGTNEFYVEVWDEDYKEERVA